LEDKLRMWKEVVISSQHLLGGIKKEHQKYESG
jgi:hypothetical protein